nr:hypothetical protein Q903MT_gene1756 [Picea sitchensis]
MHSEVRTGNIISGGSFWGMMSEGGPYSFLQLLVSSPLFLTVNLDGRGNTTSQTGPVERSHGGALC